MKNNEGYEKAMKIYELIKDIKWFDANYNVFNGRLQFSFRKDAWTADCYITPLDNDTYSIKFQKTFNMYQYCILEELHGVKAEELKSTILKVMESLNEEWNKANRKSWWRYKEMLRYSS